MDRIIRGYEAAFGAIAAWVESDEMSRGFKVFAVIAAVVLLMSAFGLALRVQPPPEYASVTEEVTVETTVEETVEVESEESKAKRAQRKADLERQKEEALNKTYPHYPPSDDDVDLPNLPNPNLPNIPGSHCVGKGFFKICV